MFRAHFGPKPLNFENGEKPGDYRLATVINEGTLNPGDWANIKQYITGYGEISGIKIVTYISNDLFDEDSSYLKCSLGVSEENPELYRWGTKRINFSNSGISYFPGGLIRPDWNTRPFIFDAGNSYNSILTEKGLPDAPLTYKLKLKSDAAPGQHYIVFYMTYFNGEKWVCIEEKATIKINNKFEQYSTALSILAALALIVTIFHDGIYPILECFHEIGKTINLARKS